MSIFEILKNEKEKWISKFYEIRYKNPFSKDEYIESNNFKNYKMPNHLYQYTKAKYIDDLLDELMFLRSFDDLNDPFDGHFLGNNEIVTKIDVFELKDGSCQINVTKHKIEVDWNYKKEYKVACFCEENNNAPMWHFYGDEHKGICVEYNFHKNALFEFFCLPINYVTSTNNYTITDQLIEEKDPSNRTAEELFVKKAQSWSYEKEWRIIIHDSKPFKGFEFEIKNDKKYLKFLKPEAVYLGLKMPDETKKEIKEKCKDKNIKVYEMVEDTSGYNLIPK